MFNKVLLFIFAISAVAIAIPVFVVGVAPVVTIVFTAAIGG